MTDEHGDDGMSGGRAPRLLGRALGRLLGRLPGRRRDASADDVLRLRRELRGARLDLAERDRAAERARAELARARDAAARGAERRAQADLERLAAAIGTPLVQFMTQAHLHRTGAARVGVEDVLDVGTRLVRGLREIGVDAVGEPGAVEPFDPSRHDPLSDDPLSDAAGTGRAGRPVVVRVPGLACRGRVVRKAGVEEEGG
ncbi:hypothetical protein [Actinomadura chibensis]|uniref:Nucleotide exchange factor GrpE n=1 Tax=Actinomadura chibensis TaxID=392828 RepID=A0A5D0NLZ7_9ACTN|nr:hypothetical protein [Actinomadura chibensis]TYB45425.1 hypothetical protein FXF69_18475 [Actinomadura chibensis]